MNETWFLVDIYLKERENFKGVLIEAIEPAMNILEKKNLLETFHFFTEPPIFSEDLRISLRIRVKDEKDKEEVKNILKDNLEKVQTFLIRETDFDREEYNGECDKFGEKGWVIAQRVFEYGSRVSIFILKDNATNPPNGGKEFRPEKFIHCFLNQIGSTDVFYKSISGQLIWDETLFHFDRYLERMAVKERKTIEQAKDIIKKLLEQGYGAEYFQLI